MSADRRALRARAKALRDGMDPSLRRDASAAIVAMVRALPVYRAARRVMAYSPIGSEVDIRPLMADDKLFVLPRCGPGPDQMEACAPCDLVPGPYGILEPGPRAEPVPPQELDLVLVPCLAFDDRGYRLGYGGGYYDAFLPRLGGRGAAVLVAFAGQRVPCIEPRAGERPADVVVTQEGWFTPPDQG